MTVANDIAAVAVLVALASAVFAGMSARWARRSAVAAGRSADAAERSAAVGESSLEIERERQVLGRRPVLTGEVQRPFIGSPDLVVILESNETIYNLSLHMPSYQGVYFLKTPIEADKVRISSVSIGLLRPFQSRSWPVEVRSHHNAVLKIEHDATTRPEDIGKAY
jgi:hypothetical protein